MGAVIPAAPPLPTIAAEVLTSIYQHRLLTTAQVHQMHMQGHTRRWAEQILATLTSRGLTAFVRTGLGGTHRYYLTLAGAQAVEVIPTRVETRRKLISPEQAAGTLWQHTLAVNDVGIAFMQAARARSDDFGPFAWRHEIAHQAPTAGHTRGELLIADALLTYLAIGQEMTFHYRLLELDRATVPTDTLASKLARYTHLYRHTPAGQSQLAWQQRYPIFPDIICVLTGQGRSVLKRRAQTVLALCRADPRLTSTPEVRISLTLLEDLQAEGPFAPIWHTPDNPTLGLDWLGRKTEEERA